jgi:hypothetical protein
MRTLTVVLGLSFYALLIVQGDSQTSDSVSIPRAAWEQLESAIHGVAEAMRTISSAQAPTPTPKIQPTSQPPSTATGELAQDPDPPVTTQVHSDRVCCEPHRDRDCCERPRDRDCCEPHQYRGCCEPHRDSDCCEPRRYRACCEPRRDQNCCERPRDRDCCEPHRYRGYYEPHRYRDCWEPHRYRGCCEPHRGRDRCERPRVSAFRSYGGVGRRWPVPFADGYEPSAYRYEWAPRPPEDSPYGYED